MKQKTRNVLLATTLLLSNLASCATQESQTLPGAENAPTVEDSIERMTISYWDLKCNEMDKDSYTESLIEAAFPVTMEMNYTDSQNPAHVMRLLEEGSFPDVFWFTGEMGFVESFELSRSIPREMVAEHAPSLLALYEENPALYSAITTPGHTDEFFALTGYMESSTAIANSQYADYYRYDWMEALGMELPMEVTQITENLYVAERGFTLSEFEEVMEAFTYGDPDGNGEDDTFGASFDQMMWSDLLYSGFGMISGVNEVAGKAEMHYASPAYRDYVSWFQDMYSKGYFDENLNQSRQERWEVVNQEKAGYFLESTMALNSWASNRPPLTLLERNPQAKFLITYGLTQEDGSSVMKKSALPSNGQRCYISKEVDDEKLAMILQIIEYANFGEENFSFWYGEEGVDWEQDQEGTVTELNPMVIGEKGTKIFIQNIHHGELFIQASLQENFLAGADFWLGDDCQWRSTQREQYEYKQDLFGETGYQEWKNLNEGACLQINQEYFQAWVLEGLSVEDTWEEYLLALEEAGYREMMAELDQVAPLAEVIESFVS